MSDSTKAKGGSRSTNIVVLVAIMLLLTANQAASYGGNVVLPARLTVIGGMDYYSVCSALQSMGMMIILPLVGTLTKRFGTKRVVMSGVLLQGITRILVIVIGNVPLFIINWMVSGMSAGLYMSAPYSMIAGMVDGEKRSKYFGYLSTFSAVGALAGPYITGLIADSVYADLAIIAYFPVALFSLVVIGLMYSDQGSSRDFTQFDFAGILFLLAAVAGMVLWLSLGDKLFPRLSFAGIICLAVGVAGFLLLLKVEKDKENASVPISIFSNNRFRWTFIVRALTSGYSTCIAAYGIVYIQQVMERSSTVSSTITMPQTVVQALVGLFIGGWIGKNLQKRFYPMAVLGMGIYTAAMLIFFMLRPDSSMMTIYFATGIGGISQAITNSSLPAFFNASVKAEEYSAANGMYTFAATGGSCIFVAVCGALQNAGCSINQLFLFSAVLCGIAFFIALVKFRIPWEA